MHSGLAGESAKEATFQIATLEAAVPANSALNGNSIECARRTNLSQSVHCHTDSKDGADRSQCNADTDEDVARRVAGFHARDSLH